MQSMTGFGISRSKGELALQVSLRSVNGRFLETRFHVPREYMEVEPELKKRLGNKLHRGTVDIFISTARRPAATRSVRVDRDLVKKLRDETRSLARTLGLRSETLDLKEYLRLPGVISVEDRLEATQGERTVLLSVFDQALQRLIVERRREGASIGKSLRAHLHDLTAIVARIERLCRRLSGSLEAKLKERIDRNKDKIDPVRLGQELIFYLDRSDIKEEIDRLREHIRSCQNLLKGGGGAGKKLDFFCQELLREVNTIGSKSSSAEMTSLVVDAKTLVESIREQVQNLE